VTTVARRAVVAEWRAAAGLSERRACRFLGVRRSSQRYQARRTQPAGLRERLTELAAARPRWGYRRLWVLLRREGYAVNWKRVYRLYREAGLAVKRRRRKRTAVVRRPLPPATRPNERWSMDFVHDRLINGRWFRSLTIVDDFTRECLAIEVDTSLGGARVAEVLTQLAQGRPLARTIVVDNGPEFAGRVLDAWAYRPRDHAGLHSAGEADAERVYRKLQQPAPRRVLERPLVCDGDRSAADDRALARRLQHPASARLTRSPHPERIRRPVEGGYPRPDIVVLRPKLDQKWGAPHSLIYNVGVSSFAHSTLFELVNKGSLSAVPGQFPRWNKAGGYPVRGLANRRRAEIKLWNEPAYLKKEGGKN